MQSHVRRPNLSRRSLLRGAGVAMALPWLEAMGRSSAAASAAEAPAAGGAAKVAADGKPRRMICIQTNMGIMPQFWFPTKAGKDYEATPYLQRLGEFRDQMTLMSGVSHPGVTGGHAAERCFLTGTPHPERGGFRNWISLDQYAAEQIGDRTRYPSLVMAMSNEGQTLSYTRSGAPIPAERSPKKLFTKLFVQGKPEEVEASVEALRQGRSTLDFVGEQSKRLNGMLSAADRQRLDQYQTSVRELERRLHSAQAWETKPKPAVTAKAPEDIDDQREIAGRSRLVYDVARLAFETDSTRVISLFVDTVVIHNITHHGNRPEVVAELRSKEEAQFDALNTFLKGLRDVKEEGESLLDRTIVLYGTCMGSANSHSNTNLPVMVAGGGFRHAGHLAFDTHNNYPLANLYVSMLQRLGVETDKFSTGKGTMRGLEMA